MGGDDNDGTATDLCPICRNPMDEQSADEPVYEWTRCRHLLHRACFEAMRRSEIELRCPICRLDAHGVAS
eukprot:408113-Lingulodinium_polyedra.AAC.1